MSTRHRRPWFQLGLRTSLVLATVAMLAAGGLAYLLRYVFGDTYFIIDF